MKQIPMSEQEKYFKLKNEQRQKRHLGCLIFVIIVIYMIITYSKW